MKTIIIYGSTTGTTEGVAQDLGSAFEGAQVMSTDEASADALQGVDLLVLGASTWGMGDLQDDMAAFLEQLIGWDISAKAGAVFGTGDQFGYADTYVDGIADMVDALKGKNIPLVGAWSTEGYEHGGSRAQEGDKFAGLALDQDNESEKTADRITEWVKQIKAEVGA